VPLGCIGKRRGYRGRRDPSRLARRDYVIAATLIVDGGIVYANPGIKGSGLDS
jgi:hypothetical protein